MEKGPEHRTSKSKRKKEKFYKRGGKIGEPTGDIIESKRGHGGEGKRWVRGKGEKSEPNHKPSQKTKG